eukprot:s1639_g8.t1
MVIATMLSTAYRHRVAALSASLNGKVLVAKIHERRIFCRHITVGVPERVKGLYRAATAPQQPISLQDKVDYALSNLEQMSSERMDPLKLRYQRRLKELHQARGVLTSSQMLRLMASLSEHPLVLYSDAARPLMEVATQRLTVAKLESPTPSHLAGASLCLALHARMRNKDPKDCPEGYALNRLLAKVVEMQATLPPSVSQAEFITRPLLATALLTPQDGQDLSPAVATVVEEESFWRGFDAKAIARAVGALGLLKEQGLVPLPQNASQRVRRMLDLERCFGRDSGLGLALPELTLLCRGLDLLELQGSLLKQARQLQQERLTLRGAAAVPMLELCETLQLMKSFGRLSPDEPFVFDMVRLAANQVDRLQRGERKMLRGLLEHLASQLGFEPGVSWVDLAQILQFLQNSCERLRDMTWVRPRLRSVCWPGTTGFHERAELRPPGSTSADGFDSGFRLRFHGDALRWKNPEECRGHGRVPCLRFDRRPTTDLL